MNQFKNSRLRILAILVPLTMVALPSAAAQEPARPKAKATYELDMKGLRCFAISPDGARIAIGGRAADADDGLVVVIDSATGKEQTRFAMRGEIKGAAEEANLPWSIRFSPDGKLVATGDSMGATVWELATGKERKVPLDGELTKPLAFSPDGAILATGKSNGLELWDVRTLQKLRTIAMGSEAAVAFSPDGKLLATAEGHNRVHLWDVATGKQLAEDHAMMGILHDIAFAPDGKTILAGGEGGARLWDLTTRNGEWDLRQRFGLRVGGPVHRVQYSPDGKLLMTCDLEGVVLSSATNGKRVALLAQSRLAQFSPDGKTLAAAVNRGEKNALQIWSLENVLRLPAAAPPPPRLTVLREKQSAAFRDHTAAVTAFAFSPDSAVFATAGDDRAIRLWDMGNGKLKRVLEGHTDGVASVAFDPAGKLLASASYDHTVRIWDLETGKLAGTLNHDHRTWFAVFSPDGTRIVSGGSDDAVHCWDIKTGKVIWKKELTSSSMADGVAFSPDGKLLALACSDGIVRVWLAATGEEKKAIPANGDRLMAVAFSRDGTRLAAGGYERTIQIWDTRDWEELAVLRGPNSKVYRITFRADGKKLATVHGDGSIGVWDLETERWEQWLRGPENYHAGSLYAGWLRDGRFVSASNGAESKVLVWTK